VSAKDTATDSHQIATLYWLGKLVTASLDLDGTLAAMSRRPDS